MKGRISVLLLMTGFVTQTPASPTGLAQTVVSGTWQTESSPPGTTWTAVLKVDGSAVSGTVSSCSSGRFTIQIFDGRIDGAGITFKCKSGNGARTLTFTGRITGDEIAFTWDKAGAGGNPYDSALFGPSAPREFSAKRVPDRTSFERIVNASNTPDDWLTYSGDLQGHRYSGLTQVTKANIKHLELAWLSQAPRNSPLNRLEATPLVVDGVMYTTRNVNDVVALDAATGRDLWVFPYAPMPGAAASGGGSRPNRGLAILHNTLYLATLDAHLLAIDAASGQLVWNTTVADARDPACQGASNCYVMTLAPLIVKNKVLVGVGGGEGPTRGFVAAFDAGSGKEAWRFNTIPGPGEPGSTTWAGDSWKTGGAPVWVTGAFDPALNLTYWGTGNPSPPYDGSARAGDNLYSDSVIALDADTGKLKWHYQFTPHDVQDWDAAQTPVLADLQWQGRPRQVLLWANRNGLFYVLDRTTGEFLLGKPFVEVNWMTGFDASGRPIRVAGQLGSREAPIRPGSATNWNPSSYSPGTGLFYVTGWERAGVGTDFAPARAYTALRALDPSTGDRRWEFKVDDVTMQAGLLTTASDLVFTGTQGTAGYFYALDAGTGDVLWRFGLTGAIQGPPITYAIRGRQYIVVAANDTLFAFALRE